MTTGRQTKALREELSRRGIDHTCLWDNVTMIESGVKWRVREWYDGMLSISSITPMTADEIVRILDGDD